MVVAVVAIILAGGGTVFRAERLKWERPPGARPASALARVLQRLKLERQPALEGASMFERGRSLVRDLWPQA